MRRTQLSSFGALLLGWTLGLAPTTQCRAQAPPPSAPVRSERQGSVELHPRLGLYFSPGLLNTEYVTPSGRVVARRQLMAITFGLGVTLWPAKFMAVEGAAVFAPSMVAITDSARTMDATSGVVLASLRTVFGIRRRTEGWSLYGGPGLGIIHRGSAASGWGRSDRTGPALVLAAGARLAMRDSPSFTIEVASYSTWISSPTAPTGAHQRRWHQDLVWSCGLAIPLAHP